VSGRSIHFAPIALLTAGNSISAGAAGFMIRENSATTVGMSYAGSGSQAEAVETAFANPAGLPHLSRDELEFEASMMVPNFKFNGTASAFGAPISGNNGGNIGHIAAIPSVYGRFSISEKLKAGFALTVPNSELLAAISSAGLCNRSPSSSSLRPAASSSLLAMASSMRWTV
jgi:long-subunit fatty acid transport protein